ncbi:MAG: hypothetical protein ACSW8B_05135 [bacterium]
MRHSQFWVLFLFLGLAIIIIIHGSSQPIEQKHVESTKEVTTTKKSSGWGSFDYSVSYPYPFGSMPERYIHMTACGRYDDYETYSVKEGDELVEETKYIWYAENGRDIPLIVICRNGEVKRVYRYYVNTSLRYWDEEEYPCFEGYRMPSSTKTTSRRRKKSTAKNSRDFYDVDDYDDVDDFIDDHGDDFIDDEEAEEYYYDHH